MVDTTKEDSKAIALRLKTVAAEPTDQEPQLPPDSSPDIVHAGLPYTWETRLRAPTPLRPIQWSGLRAPLKTLRASTVRACPSVLLATFQSGHCRGGGPNIVDEILKRPEPAVLRDGGVKDGYSQGKETTRFANAARSGVSWTEEWERKWYKDNEKGM